MSDEENANHNEESPMDTGGRFTNFELSDAVGLFKDIIRKEFDSFSIQLKQEQEARAETIKKSLKDSSLLKLKGQAISSTDDGEVMGIPEMEIEKTQVQSSTPKSKNSNVSDLSPLPSFNLSGKQ
ncbi:hypothetical protein KUTeg_018656 [Tegillarca granosa]|uniref:Uncharacterized protein n=1 Tax=Tegillarca granosa TaxID=220873 RepID=A0ABQ9EKF5_TEGGR|nr:hypothetical protein KUTeg_018656 [Tegillarca granosa]